MSASTETSNDLSAEQRQALETKLSAARTRLILDKPFLGALVLRLPLKAANPAWCATTGTDARAFYYNPDYIESLRGEELQFVMAHEALHCALSHFTRRQHRVKHLWDLACDFAINPILIAEGLTPPPGLVTLPQYAGMTAEEIYPLLDDNDLSETMDQHLYDKPDNPAEGGQDRDNDPLNTQSSKPKQAKSSQDNDNPADGTSGKQEFDESAGGSERPPPPLEQAEAEILSQQWQQRLASASQQAEQAGKLSGALKRLIDIQRQPLLPWRALLAHYLSSMARDDYSYQRPSVRREGPAIYPTLRSAHINIAVALDVSGSIGDQELNRYLSEVNVLKAHLRARVSLLACDAAVVEGFPMIFEPWETIDYPAHIAGAGSTDFRPVFAWLAQQDQAPDVLVYFTDALGNFPQQAPDFPVLWLIKGKAPIPWGQRVQYH